METTVSSSGVGDINDGQLVVAAVLGVVHCCADGQAHPAFDLEHFSKKLAGQQEDQAGVNKPDADFLFGELKTPEVSREEICQEHQADEPAARKERDRDAFPPGSNL